MANDLFSCLFRVDAGENFGFGHFRRCLPLARAMQDNGFEVTFAMAAVPDALKAAAEQSKIRVVTYTQAVKPGTREDLIHLRQIPLKQAYDWIIFDGYNFDRFYREKASRLARRSMIIQDIPGDYTDAAVFLDQNVNIAIDSYQFNSTCNILLGPRYSLAVGDRELRQRCSKFQNVCPRILLTLGGTDPKRFTKPVVKAISEIGAHLDVVLGSASGWHSSDFQDLCGTFEIYSAPDGLDILMAGADLGIMSLGITTWEMCFYGLPFVMLASNTNQQRVIDWFQKQNLADDGLKNGRFESDYLYNCIDQLLRNETKRRQRSQRLRQIIDGKGPTRVALALKEAS